MCHNAQKVLIQRLFYFIVSSSAAALSSDSVIQLLVSARREREHPGHMSYSQQAPSMVHTPYEVVYLIDGFFRGVVHLLNGTQTW